MPSIAIYSYKGGVGKSTTAVNLGAALLRRGQAVQLIDADPRADLSAFKKVLTGARWPKTMPERGTKGFTLLDCPGQVENDLEPILRAVDIVLIPCPPESWPVTASQMLLNDLLSLQSKHQLQQVARVFVTLYSGAFKDEKAEMQSIFEGHLCKTIVPRDTKLGKATNACQDIYSYAPESRAAAAYTRLAKEIEGLNL